MSYQKWRHRVAERTPAPVRNWVASARLARMRQRNAGRPVEEVFAEIYASRQWGDGLRDGDDAFDSGTGSQGAAAAGYAAYVRQLVGRSGARSAVDIGCGDFRVASLFVDALHGYHGLDVVSDLVAHNTAVHGGDGVSFAVLDASAGELPPADVCLIRQVLQHLSNGQIAEILRRCQGYPLVVVTEHLPAPGRATGPNLDKPHGPDTRLGAGSWVDISAPPFNRSPVQEVLRLPAPVPLFGPGEVLLTQLWRPGS
jgi:hypothetical protein